MLCDPGRFGDGNRSEPPISPTSNKCNRSKRVVSQSENERKNEEQASHLYTTFPNTPVAALVLSVLDDPPVRQNPIPVP